MLQLWLLDVAGKGGSLCAAVAGLHGVAAAIQQHAIYWFVAATTQATVRDGKGKAAVAAWKVAVAAARAVTVAAVHTTAAQVVAVLQQHWVVVLCTVKLYELRDLANIVHTKEVACLPAQDSGPSHA